jgi:hypothetical protein
MTMEQIIEKIRALVAELDPNLDTTSGSPFDRLVLQYIRDSFGVGELDMDISDMMVRRIQQLDDQVLLSEGGAVYEFLIKVLPSIFQVPRLEVQRIKNNQDLNNLNNMTDTEVDRRMSNFFIQRRDGDVSVGRIRAYFATPVPVTTNLTNRGITSGGLGFFPDGGFSASRNLVASQRENGLYYVDIDYVAEQSGSQYNVPAGSITTIENLPGLIRASNLEAFVGGAPRETNQALLNRAKKSIAERSLNSKNSIITTLTEAYPTKVLGVSPIGFGDPEMQRDLFKHEPGVKRSGIYLEVFTGGGPTTVELKFDDVDPTPATAGMTDDEKAGKLRVFDGVTELYAPGGYTFGHAGGPTGKDTISTVGAAAPIIVQYVTRIH